MPRNPVRGPQGSLAQDLEDALRAFEKRCESAYHASDEDLSMDLSQPLTPEEVLEKLEALMKS